MKKLSLLKMMLLLCALVAGSSNVWADDTYVRITSTTDLEVDGKYIIVSETNKVAMGTVASDKGQGVAVTISNNTITLSSSSNVNVLTLGGVSGAYTLLGSKDSKYIGYNSGTKLTSNATASTNSYKWDITFSNNNASIANKATSARLIRGYDSNKDFRAYQTSNGSDIQLYKKQTASGPVDPVLSISSDIIAVGTTATISAPDGLSVSYESGNTSVATVSDEGVVTGVAVGTAVITATWSAVADTYNAGTKSFTITVKPSVTYVKVTSVNQLVAGNEYILVATDNNMAMGAQNSKIRKNVAVTVDDDKVIIINEEVAVLTLGGTKDAWTFLASDNNAYLNYTGSSNEIYTSDDATAAGSKWKITDDFQLESAAASGRYIRYNAGSPRFACYTGQQTAILFVKEGSNVATTFEINSACTDGSKYYGTYSNDKAFIVPADLTVSAVKVADGKLVVSEYAEGDIVKANTGVMVSAATAGEKTIILTEETGTEIEGNMLKASSVDMTGDNKFYRLTMHNGTTIGFYWGAEDGAAFDLGANKAYLAVPNNASIREGLWFDETTGINSLNAEPSAMGEGSVYDLSGRRVENPTKGIYIMNGKKVVIK